MTNTLAKFVEDFARETEAARGEMPAANWLDWAREARIALEAAQQPVINEDDKLAREAAVQIMIGDGMTREDAEFSATPRRDALAAVIRNAAMVPLFDGLRALEAAEGPDETDAAKNIARGLLPEYQL